MGWMDQGGGCLVGDPRGGLPVQCRADTKDHAAGRGKGRTAVGAAGIVPDRGIPARHLFLQQSLIDQAKRALSELAAFSHACSVLTIVGLPMQWEGKVYNCAAVVYRGKLLGVVPETHLPNYGEFYERRHFMPAPQQNGRLAWEGGAVPFGQKLLFCCEELPSFTLGVEICEDLWVPDPPSIRHAMAGGHGDREPICQRRGNRQGCVSQAAGKGGRRNPPS